jgi:hypothetical protein
LHNLDEVLSCPVTVVLKVPLFICLSNRGGLFSGRRFVAEWSILMIALCSGSGEGEGELAMVDTAPAGKLKAL